MRSLRELQDQICAIAPSIDAALNPDRMETDERDVGFLLCAFVLGKDNAPLVFIANADGDDLARALTELIEKCAGKTQLVTLEPQ